MKISFTSQYKQSLSNNLTKRQQDKLDKAKQLTEALNHPDDIIGYKKAYRKVKFIQFGKNISAFAKWLIIDLLWLLPMYEMYNIYETLVQSVSNYRNSTYNVSQIVLWIDQQQINIALMLYGVVALIGLAMIVKRGWFKRVYAGLELVNQYKNATYDHETESHPDTDQQPDRNTKRNPKANQKNRKLKRNH